MRNKVELKKTIIISIFVVLIWTAIFGVLNFYQYKSYTRNFNNKISEIVMKISEEYPNIEKREIIKTLNDSETKNNEIFKEYGIDSSSDSFILKNEYEFKKDLIINIAMFIILAISIFLVFGIYNRSKDKKLEEITRYIEEINRKNYKLNIDDNTEDELAILKNEIYKTTIMLKEQAENSINDKINLKDSLSDISHQLKTPLTSINIMLDNILDNPDMEQKTRNDFIKNIRREITNINFLVQSLLKLSKLDSNTINFINSDVKIIDIINETIKNVSMLCDLKNIKIICSRR